MKGSASPEGSRQQTSPRSLNWSFVMERMTGTEPASKDQGGRAAVSSLVGPDGEGWSVNWARGSSSDRRERRSLL